MKPNSRSGKPTDTAPEYCPKNMKAAIAAMMADASIRLGSICSVGVDAVGANFCAVLLSK
jgi:hypothetical protein